MIDGHAIDLHGVEKIYRGKVQALRGIEMRVRRGEVFGLLGPNGAGKSTLVKIMMTVVRPTRADGSILGQPIGHKPTLAKVGYLPENHRFPRYLTGRQVLHLFASLSGVGRVTRQKRIGELLDTVGMTASADRKIGTYSKGMMQRIGLAQALANDPDLVVLDEPTDGVDPEGRRDIRAVLGRIRDQGKTVFVNSHLLSELEVISDRVAILVGGRVARQGTIDELTVAKQRYEIEVVIQTGGERDAIRAAMPGVFTETSTRPPQAYPAYPPPPMLPLPMPPPPIPGMAAPGQMLLNAPPPPQLFPVAPMPLVIDRGKLEGGQWAELEGPTLRLGTTDPSEVQPILDKLRSAGLMLRRLQSVRPSLEDLFMETLAAPESIQPGKQGGRA